MSPRGSFSPELMDIKVTVFKDPMADPVERTIPAGMTAGELMNEYRSHMPYRIISARVDGDDVSLTHKLKKNCEIIFCDIRDNAANRCFQRGLSFLYLKAVHDLFGGEAKVFIHNSVNRGIFTTLDMQPGSPEKEEPDEECLRKIEKRMWQLVDANIPIEKTSGKNYRLDGYTNYFYGIMPPSTGYVYQFALEAMRGGVLLRFPHPSDPGRLAVYRRDARIFDAYDDEQAFLDGLRLGQISDLNKRIKAGAEDLILTAEARHAARIQDTAQKIIDTGKRVILIAGPSSSGKTTFSKRLIGKLTELGCPPPLYLGTDDYFTERENTPRDKKGEYNYEGLDAMDVDLFVRNIGELLAGKTADLPEYSFITGKKTFGQRKTKLKKGQIIVVEGIHALNKKMSAGIENDVKFKIYISPLTQLNIDDHNRVPSTDVRLIRRMVRDNRTRGRSVVETIRQWPKVRAGESVNIFPYNNEADEIFNSTLIYELPVLKKYAEPLLSEVRPGEAAYGHAKWLLYFLSFFKAIGDESAIPAESILREFIGGGRF